MRNYKYKSPSGLERAIYAEQARIIREKHGEHVADHANYGWGVMVDATSVSVATKAYGHGILQTNALVGDSKKNFIHEWLQY